MDKKSQARLDALAREAGFKDFATFKAFNEKNRKPITNVVSSKTVQTPSKPKNFFESLLDKVPTQFTPTRTVTKKLEQVNRRNTNAKPR